MSLPETLQNSISAVQQAATDGKLSDTAVENIVVWLTEDRYAAYRDQVAQHIADQKWQELDDAFWTIIPFGTGGRRGRMYPIGSNAINDRTIGESAQGLADYVVEYHGAESKSAESKSAESKSAESKGAESKSAESKGGKKQLSCAIAYDTRHKSRHFTELCAGIMVAAGFKVYLLDDYRATPQLSFAVREKNCDCGIMVTASHNPPSDNAVKVYWSSGAQILPPHDKAIIDRVMACQEIRVTPFADAVAAGKVEVITDEIDQKYKAAASACAFAGPREAKIVYSPLHGVGAAAVLPLLKQDGFTDVELYGPHSEPSGDFPNVPGHVSNPENTAIFDEPIKHGQAVGADLILATDPDCDRIGCAAPIGSDPSGPWRTFNGNEIGAILADFVLRKRAEAGTLSPVHYIVKTLVTTELTRSIAETYGVRCEGDLLVGFKYIAHVIDRDGPDKFVYGTEESHGYLVGQYCRDKDGAVACMLMCELVAELKSKGITLHDYLCDLHRKHGYHSEQVINLFMEGSEGMAAMKRLMQSFRDNPPRSLAGIEVAQIRDYSIATTTNTADGSTQPLTGPNGDLVIMDLAEAGNYVAVRPSGTEPKIKLYVFTRMSPADSADLEKASATLAARIKSLEADVRAYAAQNA